MREIKFRVWDKHGKYMRYLGDDSHDSIEFFDENRASYYNLQCGDGGASTTEEDCDGYGFSPLMQYTGLKDKNGKEIYEGDIVEAKYCIDGCLYYIEDEYGVIQWDDKQCAFNLIFKDQLAPSPISYYVSFEVVGNVYENPELLEVQND